MPYLADPHKKMEISVVGTASFRMLYPAAALQHSEHRRLLAQHGCYSDNTLFFLNECTTFTDWMSKKNTVVASQSKPHPIRDFFAHL